MRVSPHLVVHRCAHVWCRGWKGHLLPTSQPRQQLLLARSLLAEMQAGQQVLQLRPHQMPLAMDFPGLTPYRGRILASRAELPQAASAAKACSRPPLSAISHTEASPARLEPEGTNLGSSSAAALIVAWAVRSRRKRMPVEYDTCQQACQRFSTCVSSSRHLS